MIPARARVKARTPTVRAVHWAPRARTMIQQTMRVTLSAMRQALRVMGRWNVLRRRKKFVMSVTRSSNAVPRSCG